MAEHATARASITLHLPCLPTERRICGRTTQKQAVLFLTKGVKCVMTRLQEQQKQIPGRSLTFYTNCREEAAVINSLEEELR